MPRIYYVVFFLASTNKFISHRAQCGRVVETENIWARRWPFTFEPLQKVFQVLPIVHIYTSVFRTLLPTNTCNMYTGSVVSQQRSSGLNRQQNLFCRYTNNIRVCYVIIIFVLPDFIVLFTLRCIPLPPLIIHRCGPRKCRNSRMHTSTVYTFIPQEKKIKIHVKSSSHFGQPLIFRLYAYTNFTQHTREYDIILSFNIVFSFHFILSSRKCSFAYTSHILYPILVVSSFPSNHACTRRTTPYIPHRHYQYNHSGNIIFRYISIYRVHRHTLTQKK